MNLERLMELYLYAKKGGKVILEERRLSVREATLVWLYTEVDFLKIDALEILKTANRYLTLQEAIEKASKHHSKIKYLNHSGESS